MHAIGPALNIKHIFFSGVHVRGVLPPKDQEVILFLKIDTVFGQIVQLLCCQLALFAVFPAGKLQMAPKTVTVAAVLIVLFIECDI